MNFSEIVSRWYKKNKRDLPWRRTRDPYLVWISEVILQQTRVAQGLEYYKAFALSYPDVNSLARATEEEVLKLWQGLGYYSRARNMHQAARELVRHHKGRMPQNYEGLLEMKGIGSYTAAAIASICFGEEKAVVDGNVSRVIARYFGVDEAINSTAGKHIIDSMAAEIMAERPQNISPGTHNQAMMEFGALQCVPNSPRCGACPLAAQCHAYLSGSVKDLPVKIPKRKATKRWMYFYMLRNGNETILSRRDEPGIWRSLYHFPMVESTSDQPFEEITGALFDRTMNELTTGVAEPQPSAGPASSSIDPQFSIVISEPMRHQLTHLSIHARFIQIGLLALPTALAENFIRIPIGDLEKYPVPRLMERYMEVAKF